MKKITKWVAYVAISLILVVIITSSYVILALPNVGKPEDIKIALTPQRIARGAYLANHVDMCMDCHSERDWSKPIGPITADKLGAGGDIFDAGDGYPGTVQVPNITPYKLKSWTDGEIMRAITEGVRKDGSAIFPLMPWPGFAKMSREDLYSIIAYLRSIKPIATPPYQPQKLDFPLNILVHTMPEKAGPFGQIPSPADTVKYGAYITNAAACEACHSQHINGAIPPELEFAGGVAFKIGTKTFLSANITPDKNTGIGNWTSSEFVQFFKSHTDSARAANPTAKIAASAMPVYDYSGMTETDLKAIYAYLKKVKPVHNKVASE
jgi:hypothetical protein